MAYHFGTFSHLKNVLILGVLLVALPSCSAFRAQGLQYDVAHQVADSSRSEQPDVPTEVENVDRLSCLRQDNLDLVIPENDGTLRMVQGVSSSIDQDVYLKAKSIVLNSFEMKAKFWNARNGLNFVFSGHHEYEGETNVMKIEMELVGFELLTASTALDWAASLMANRDKLAKKQKATLYVKLRGKGSATQRQDTGLYEAKLEEQEAEPFKFVITDQWIIEQALNRLDTGIDKIVFDAVWPLISETIPKSLIASFGVLEDEDLTVSVDVDIQGSQRDEHSNLNVQTSIAMSVDMHPAKVLGYFLENVDLSDRVERAVDGILRRKFVQQAWKDSRGLFVENLAYYGLVVNPELRETVTRTETLEDARALIIKAARSQADTLGKVLEPFAKACSDKGRSDCNFLDGLYLGSRGTMHSRKDEDDGAITFLTHANHEQPHRLPRGVLDALNLSSMLVFPSSEEDLSKLTMNDFRLENGMLKMTHVQAEKFLFALGGDATAGVAPDLFQLDGGLKNYALTFPVNIPFVSWGHELKATISHKGDITMSNGELGLRYLESDEVVAYVLTPHVRPKDKESIDGELPAEFARPTRKTKKLTRNDLVPQMASEMSVSLSGTSSKMSFNIAATLNAELSVADVLPTALAARPKEDFGYAFFVGVFQADGGVKGTVVAVVSCGFLRIFRADVVNEQPFERIDMGSKGQEEFDLADKQFFPPTFPDEGCVLLSQERESGTLWTSVDVFQVRLCNVHSATAAKDLGKAVSLQMRRFLDQRAKEWSYGTHPADQSQYEVPLGAETAPLLKIIRDAVDTALVLPELEAEEEGIEVPFEDSVHQLGKPSLPSAKMAFLEEAPLERKDVETNTLAPLELQRLEGPSLLSGASALAGQSALAGPSALSGASALAGPSPLAGPSALSGPSALAGPSALSGPSAFAGPSPLSGASAVAGQSALAGPSALRGDRNLSSMASSSSNLSFIEKLAASTAQMSSATNQAGASAASIPMGMQRRTCYAEHMLDTRYFPAQNHPNAMIRLALPNVVNGEDIYALADKLYVSSLDLLLTIKRKRANVFSFNLQKGNQGKGCAICAYISGIQARTKSLMAKFGMSLMKYEEGKVDIDTTLGADFMYDPANAQWKVIKDTRHQTVKFQFGSGFLQNYVSKWVSKNGGIDEIFFDYVWPVVESSLPPAVGYALDLSDADIEYEVRVKGSCTEPSQRNPRICASDVLKLETSGGLQMRGDPKRIVTNYLNGLAPGPEDGDDTYVKATLKLIKEAYEQKRPVFEGSNMKASGRVGMAPSKTTDLNVDGNMGLTMALFRSALGDAAETLIEFVPKQGAMSAKGLAEADNGVIEIPAVDVSNVVLPVALSEGSTKAFMLNVSTSNLKIKRVSSPTQGPDPAPDNTMVIDPLAAKNPLHVLPVMLQMSLDREHGLSTAFTNNWFGKDNMATSIDGPFVKAMIEYHENWLVLLLFRLRGSVSCRAACFALPAALITFMLAYNEQENPGFLDDLGVRILTNSQLWTAATTVLGILLIFRTNRAMARFWEGTGLLHQMRGEWFDSVSCCVTFTRGALDMRPDDVMEFRHTIVRLMSLCHASALEEIAGETEELETIDTYGLNSATLMHLKDCKDVHRFNMVEVLLHLIQTLITQSLEDGVLKIPAPILSRVYQTLSRGFVNLLNAKKIADTRFPFPYAQLISMMLFLNVFMTPCLIVCLTDNKFWAPIFAFVPIFGFASLNFIGVELENPFGDDANDLPLEHFQTEMNKCLLMLLQENADLCPGTSPLRAKYVFRELQDSMEEMRRLTRSIRSGSSWGSDTKGLKLKTERMKLTVAYNSEGASAQGMPPLSLPLDPKKRTRLSIAEAFARAEQEALQKGPSRESEQSQVSPQRSTISSAQERAAEQPVIPNGTLIQALDMKAAGPNQQRSRSTAGTISTAADTIPATPTMGSTPPSSDRHGFEGASQEIDMDDRIEAAVATAMDVIDVLEESPQKATVHMAEVGSYSIENQAGLHHHQHVVFDGHREY